MRARAGARRRDGGRPDRCVRGRVAPASQLAIRAEVDASPSVPAPAAGVTDAQVAADRAAERLRLLRTCPAEAPSWSDYLEDRFPEGLAGEVEQRHRSGLLGDLAYVEALHRRYEQDLADDPAVADGGRGLGVTRGIRLADDRGRGGAARSGSRTEDGRPRYRIVDRYLRGLARGSGRSPAGGRPRTRSVVVQVTRDAEERTAPTCRQIVGDTAVIVVEAVRWSLAELKRASVAIEDPRHGRPVERSESALAGATAGSRWQILGDAEGRRASRLEALSSTPAWCWSPPRGRSRRRSVWRGCAGCPPRHGVPGPRRSWLRARSSRSSGSSRSSCAAVAPRTTSRRAWVRVPIASTSL